MPNTFQLSVFRSPRHHVLSQYMMCACVLGGKKGHLIPFASPKGRYQIGLGKWLGHSSASRSGDALVTHDPRARRANADALARALLGKARDGSQPRIAVCATQGYAVNQEVFLGEVTPT